MASLAVFGSIGADCGKFQYPHGIAASSTGEVAVVDTCNHRVQVFSGNGQFKRLFGRQGLDFGLMNFPDGVTYDHDDNIVVADSDNHRMQVFSSNGELVKVFGSENLRNPWGVCTTSDGNIAVCSGGEKREVQVYSPDGVLLSQLQDRSTKSRPSYVVHSHDKYFVSYSDDQCVKAFDNQGKLLFSIGEPGIANAQFNRPRGLAVDMHNQLLICDGWNNRIQVFSIDGKFLSKFGSPGKEQGNLTFPVDLTVTRDGRVFVSELKGHRVQIFQGLPQLEN